MKVLMATDGSTDANTAIVTALRLLRRDDLSIDVLCVAPQLVAAPHREHEINDAKHVLLSTERLLHREGLRSSVSLKVGPPAETIKSLAPEYDLVVVGAHGKYERTQPGLGPVANHLVENATGSVMVGRELVNEKSFRVLAAIDGSEASQNALRALPAFLDPKAIDVTLMHVMETPWARLSGLADGDYEPDASEIPDYQRELEIALLRNADIAMGRARTYLESLDISATEIIEDGDPGLELVSHAEEGGYDLIVVGATGSSDVKHALLGSVSWQLAWNAPCSVIVVRR
jgi:nucleotide-binding universal stress UspA family protein